MLADDYLSADLLRLADRAGGRRWLLARPLGTTTWIGPRFEPGGTSCMHCLQARMRALRSAHRLAAHHDPEHGTREPLGVLDGVVDAACAMVATEAAKTLSGVGSALDGGIRAFDVRDWSADLHHVIRRPVCEHCGGLPAPGPAPIELRPNPVAFDTDGGHRTMTPEETLRRHAHLVSPLAGIVGALMASEHAPGVGRAFWAVEGAYGRLDHRLKPFLHTFRLSSGGKGITESQAKAGALCEALERYSGRLQGNEVQCTASLRSLDARAIHPNDVMRFSERQYREREVWNAEGAPSRQRVPVPLDPDLEIDWTPVWSLTAGRQRLLPTGLLYYDERGRTAGRDMTIACSNGCAAGNTIEEAILQGFFELVERDAVAMWWYNQLRRPSIDLESFGNPWISGLRQRYREFGRELVALDLTNDLGIPTIVAVSFVPEGPRERIALGFGCHADAQLAAQRAFTELVQMLTPELSGNEMNMEDLANDWMRQATRKDYPYLVPDEAAPARTLEDFPASGARDIAESIEVCRATVERLGMEMLVLDQTRPDAGLPVVKVIVPGLRHFWPRFGAGRLYDVPVRMGWLDAPVPEAGLNPTPCIF